MLRHLSDAVHHTDDALHRAERAVRHPSHITDHLGRAMRYPSHVTGHLGRALRHTGHAEGRVARSIEEQTAKLPSDLFLWAAFASILASLVFEFTGYKRESLFVGQWVPTLLILGLYNKIVKLFGSDS